MRTLRESVRRVSHMLLLGGSALALAAAGCGATSAHAASAGSRIIRTSRPTTTSAFLKVSASSTTDCGEGQNSEGNSVDYPAVYTSSNVTVCVDSSVWSNSSNASAISAFFPYFEAVIAKDKQIFPLNPLTPFVFVITDSDGLGAGTGCSLSSLPSSLGSCSTYADTTPYIAYVNGNFVDPVTGVTAPNFWGYVFSLHESLNAFAGQLSPGWPTDWWADHRSPFPSAMDAAVTQYLGKNDTSLGSTMQQELLLTSQAQADNYAQKSPDYDSEVLRFLTYYGHHGFSGFSNAFKYAFQEDKLQWPSVSGDTGFTGDDDYSERLSEYVLAYLELGGHQTGNQTASWTAAGVGTLDKTIPAYTMNPANVAAIATAHCSIQSAAKEGVDVSAALAELQQGNFQSAVVQGGTQASCPSECAFVANECVAKFPATAPTPSSD